MFSAGNTEAIHAWNRARSRAVWLYLFYHLRGKRRQLLSFEDISSRLGLSHAVYRGVQEVPLNSIIGSEGRYQEFDRAFLPTKNITRDRWLRVAGQTLATIRGGTPPVELFKVGNWYFVRDGNHRTSVARQMGNRTIEAYVYEFSDPIPDDCGDLETFLLNTERTSFYHKTGLGTLHPDSDIQLTLPGGYVELLCQIEQFQDALSKIDQMEIAYGDAVAAWYEMQYEPAVSMIERSGILKPFSERTPADFYVWVMREEDQLRRRFGHTIPIDRALQRLRGFRPFRWLRNLLRRS